MAGDRDDLLRRISAELRQGTYRPDLDAIAAAALARLTPSPIARFAAVVLLRDPVEKGLVLLALAERGAHATCLAEDVPLDEIVALSPGLMVADARSSEDRRARWRQALPNVRLLLVGDGSSGHSLLRRPLRLGALQAGLDAVLPARLAWRGLPRTLMLADDPVLAAALRGAGREVVCADPRGPPPAGKFDLVFLSRTFGADPNVRATLFALYGPGLIVCTL